MSIGPFAARGEVKTVLVRGGAFHDGFAQDIKRRPELRTLGIAVVDLTTGDNRYATTDQEHVDKHVFSLAKLAPFVAAYRLRERLRNQFRGDPATSSDKLIANIEKAWKPAVMAQTSGRPGQPDFPNLRKIFDLSGPPWTFNFKGDFAGATAAREKLVWKVLQGVDDRYNQAIPKSEIDTLVFAHRLKLMVRMSDNMASGSIASDIGMSYMFGVMTSEGLYNASKQHGLWLSNTYGYDNKFMGFEGSGVQLTAGATAFSIAEYLTRLVRSKLVDPQASADMLKTLEIQSGIGIGSFFDAPNVTHSKVGLLQEQEIKDKKGRVIRIIPQNASEGAIVSSFGKNAAGARQPIKFIAVGLQDVGGTRIGGLVEIMEAHVKQANGLT